ncbi:MAG TPA: ATP-binding protein [Vicinamibacterales bacterium]|nr:ATP-binding protein [Vicinamibacterales bacterium]
MLDARRPPLQEYALALGVVALATAARFGVDGLIGNRAPYAAYIVAIVAVGLTGNLGAALFTTAVGAIVGNYLFIPPRGSFGVTEPADVFTVALFIATGCLVAVLAHRIQRSRSRLWEAARTEAQHAAAVRAERERLQDIIQSIPGVVWEAWGEPDSNLQRTNYVSDYVETMLGYRPEEWTSQPNFWLQLVHPDDRERAARVAAEKFHGGGAGENEFRWMTRDGRTLWVNARSSTMLDESGTPVGMRGVTFDITQQKEIEQRLALLAEISTTGLTTIPFDELAALIARRAAEVVGEYCIIRMRRDGKLETVAWAHPSPEADPLIREIASHSDIAELSGLYARIVENPRTIVDNDLDEGAFAHVNRTGLEDLFQRYRARRGIFTPFMSQGTLLGTLALGRASGPPYTDADGQFAEAIAARAALAVENSRLVDIARRDAEEARLARAQAEEAGRVKDEFLATLSHELRTPLNAILGWAHMLRDPLLPAERRQAAVETIVRNAQSQEQLISDILDVQRIMAGKVRLNLRPVDLGSVIRAAAETVQPSADAKQVRLQLLVDLDTPPISGDADRLQQVVWNLLSNAIKFAPPQGRVQVRLLKADSHCELIVEDNGPGIDPTFIPYMFERFRQADSSTTRTHKGLGLGLAIVRSLVEMHGGTIEAANAPPPGTGAVFTLQLPRQSPHALGPDATVGDDDDWSGEWPSLDGLQVLVVEDDPDARELLTAILHRCGAQATSAASAAEGMAAFEVRRPDVVVSDIEMPEEDGYSFIRRVRALGPDQGGSVPAAALTAYASPADRMRVLSAGFNIHVAKPVQPAELAMVVASLSGRRR